MKKKLICITIALSAAFVTPLFSVTSHAETLNTKVEYNNIANEKSGFITAEASDKITKTELSKDIDTKGWKSFNTEEEAIEYVNSMTQKLVDETNVSSFNKFTTNFMYKGYRQAQKNVGFVTAYMTVPYTAKWSSSKRKNYYSDSETPSSGITGFTWQNSWEQISGTSNIENDGDKLTGVVTGNFKTHLITSGLPAVYSRQVTIRGSWGRP